MLLKDLSISEIHISMAHEDEFAVAYAMAMAHL
jgi:phosphopantetheinyl transferase (holo-ACP synthase)